ncbi:MAG TPA: TylF/MycF/NovP-related O-methyltransferase [Verrucomicrobiae bacterium]
MNETAIGQNTPTTDDEALREQYLYMVKMTVSHALWDETTRPIDPRRSPKNITRIFATTALNLLKPFKLRLVLDEPVDIKSREEGKIWPEFAHTMIGIKRLDNLKRCAETVLREGVPGDFIETGVWRGGASIFMRAILMAHAVDNRKVWVADSFKGLPPPDAEKYPADKGADWHEPEYLAVSLEKVKEHFSKYNLLDDQVCFLEGWFRDTLPKAPIDKLAILRLDGDMYESTMDAISSLYPKLSKGGFLIIDDYGAVEACRKAITDYRAKHKINDSILQTDSHEYYWRRS